MKLPSKSTPYKNSVIVLFSDILSVLQQGECSVLELYRQTGITNISDYMNALDCLYALGKIEISEEGGLMRYVGRNVL